MVPAWRRSSRRKSRSLRPSRLLWTSVWTSFSRPATSAVVTADEDDDAFAARAGDGAAGRASCGGAAGTALATAGVTELACGATGGALRLRGPCGGVDGTGKPLV